MAESTKPRKILGTHDAPYFDSLKELISSQSRATLLAWVIKYAEANYLPIFEARIPDDPRPRATLRYAQIYKLAQPLTGMWIRAKALDCHAAARAAEFDPAAQAAARACALASSTIYELGHTLGVGYFGAAAVAYDRVGITADEQTYEQLAAEEIARYCAALEAIAVVDDPEPCLIEWRL